MNAVKARNCKPAAYLRVYSTETWPPASNKPGNQDTAELKAKESETNHGGFDGPPLS